MSIIAFDLDDTLYKEIDYLKSAYTEIAQLAASQTVSQKSFPAVCQEAYNAMMEAYLGGGNAFEALNELLNLSTPIKKYLETYRTHRPNIRLNDETVATLNALKAEGHVIGIITDGRSIQQRNKIEALQLRRWVSPEDIVISEEFGSEKPAEANYRHFMLRYPECHKFVYVGDNPKKDFIAPNRLGWKTICLLDNGQNIHKQQLQQSSEEDKSKNNIVNYSLNFTGQQKEQEECSASAPDFQPQLMAATFKQIQALIQ
jgi:putative hydrolase of the HAD superfamily